MSPEDVQHVLDRVRARMPVAPATMEAALEYIGERWINVSEVRAENALLKSTLTTRIEEVRELKEEIEELKRERPVQSDDEPEPAPVTGPGSGKAGSGNCRYCDGWGCRRCENGNCVSCLPDCLPRLSD